MKRYIDTRKSRKLKFASSHHLGQNTVLDVERSVNACFTVVKTAFLRGWGLSPWYKKTTSTSIPVFIWSKSMSFFNRNASLIYLLSRLRWVAFRIPRVTVKPTRTSDCSDGVEQIKAFIGFLSYFLPQAITLVKDPNPRRVVIDGCTRGKNTPSFWRAVSYLSLLTESFFLPAARLRFKTFRPFFVAIRALNPCVFFLFRLCGW